jgi:tetratricopeptide (TPR) repeat protein
MSVNFEYRRHYARAWLWRLCGRDEKAFAEYLVAHRLQPDDLPSARHLACIAAESKRYAAADKWFVECLRLAPDDADLHYNHGFVLEQAGSSRAAIAAFSEALRRKPALDRAWYGRGLAHARLGEHAAAAEAFAHAVELQPMHAEAYYLWGMACHHAACPQQVEEVVERLVNFDAKLAARLVRDVGREDDLGPLVPEMPF